MKPQIVAAIASVILSTITVAHAAVEISTKPTSNMICSAGVCSPTAKKAVLNVGDLEVMLASGDVKVTSGAQAKDIETNAVLSWVSAQRLTLDAYHSLTFNKSLRVAGNGALTIITNDGGTGGDYQFSGGGHVVIRHTTSSLIINGVNCFLVGKIRALRDATAHGGVGCIALTHSIDLLGKNPYQDSPIPGMAVAFEGLGNTVSNLRIFSTHSGETGLGFFGTIMTVQHGQQVFTGSVRDFGLVGIDVSGSANAVGGLVGSSEGPIQNCYVTGRVSGGRGVVGGLAGAARIIRSHASVDVTGENGATAAGGLLGSIGSDQVTVGYVSESYATGSVTGASNVPVGGLVGWNDGGQISNSYALGSVTAGSGASAGGLIGLESDSGTNGNVPPVLTASYSTGAVSGGAGATLGGLIGNDTFGGGITSTYWDLDTSSISDPSRGAGSVANDPGITGLTDAQLKSNLPVGFDRNVWAQKASINNGLPYLVANTPQN